MTSRREPDIDPDVLQQAIDGDQRACARVVGRYRFMVANAVAEVIGFDQPDVQDVCQVAFEKAFVALRKKGCFTREGGAKFSTWLSTIAHHAALDRKRALRDEADGDVEALASAWSTPEQLLEQLQNYGLLMRAVEALPETYRPVAALRMEEVDNDAIAERLGIGKNVASVRWTRAKERLRSIYRTWLKGER